MSSLIVSVCVYILVTFLLLIFSIRSILSFNNINRLVQNIDVKKLLTDMDDSNLIFKELYSFTDSININKNSTDALLNSYTIKYLVSQYIYGEIYYLTTGNENMILTNEKFTSYISKNLTDIIDDANIKYSESEINNIKKLINKNSNKLLDSLPDAKTISNSMDVESVYYIRVIFSNQILISLLLIIVISILLLMLFRWSLYSWIKWFSISIGCSSFICIAMGLLPMFNFTSLITGMPMYINNIIDTSKTIISLNFIIIGVLCLVFSIILYLINVFINKKKTINMD